MTDRELLIAYQRKRSAELFSQLVDRHVGFVYSTALRRVRNGHIAEDVSQEVFILLFRKVSTIDGKRPLEAWLFGVTCKVALDALRRAATRTHHEREAVMTTPASVQDDPASTLLAAEVDAAVADLPEEHRDTLLLRYFAGKPHQEIAANLGISEPAARKRLERASEALRVLLTRRGLAVPAATLAASLAALSMGQAAPATLAATVTQAALASSTAAAMTASGATLIVGLTKTKVLAAVVSLVILLPLSVAAVRLVTAFTRPPTSVLPPAVASLPATFGKTFDFSSDPTLRQVPFTRVSVDMTNKPAREAMHALGEATALSFVAPDGRLFAGPNDQFVTLRLKDAPLLEALLRFGEQTRTRPTELTNTSARFEAGINEKPLGIWCVSGPFALEILHWFHKASLDGQGAARTSQLWGLLMAEPGVKVLAFPRRLTIERAVDDAGQSIAFGRASEIDGSGGFPGLWRRSFFVPMELPGRPGRALPQLKVRADFVIMSDSVHMECDVSALEPRMAAAGGMKVELHPRSQEGLPALRFTRGELTEDHWRRLQPVLPEVTPTLRTPDGKQIVGTRMHVVTRPDEVTVQFEFDRIERLPQNMPKVIVVDVPLDVRTVSVPFVFDNVLLP